MKSSMIFYPCGDFLTSGDIWKAVLRPTRGAQNSLGVEDFGLHFRTWGVCKEMWVEEYLFAPMPQGDPSPLHQQS
jgi:hypothetical protein